jgi:hypothetical protein
MLVVAQEDNNRTTEREYKNFISRVFYTP